MSKLTEREHEILDKVSDKSMDFYAGILALHIARTHPTMETVEIVNHVESVFDDVGNYFDSLSSIFDADDLSAGIE